MRKLCIIFLASIIISVTALGLFASTETAGVNPDYIRIHIRANDDEPQAQAVKYAVKDVLVQALTPIVAECESYAQAKSAMQRNEEYLSALATEVLREKGFSYGATATLKTEYFPTRVYGEYTLQAGEYLALIVELGRAEGQNSWCVIYPPLCFAGQANTPVRYKSKILEIIKAWADR
jgi:stage II sporulation protein R